MMSTSVRTHLLKAFESFGFDRGLGGVFTESSEALLVVDPNITRKTGQFSLSAGLWIKCLGEGRPSRYFKCHVYGSAGAVFPAAAASVNAIQASSGSSLVPVAGDQAARLVADASGDLLT